MRLFPIPEEVRIDFSMCYIESAHPEESLIKGYDGVEQEE